MKQATEQTRKCLDQLNTDELINLCYDQLNLKKEDANALKFTNALVQLAEEQLTRQLIELSTGNPKNFAKINKKTDVIRDLYLREKIDIICNIDAQRFKPLISFLINMKDTLRNQVFHSKLVELKYGKKNISDIKTQRDIVSDYIKANTID